GFNSWHPPPPIISLPPAVSVPRACSQLWSTNTGQQPIPCVAKTTATSAELRPSVVQRDGTGWHARGMQLCRLLSCLLHWSIAPTGVGDLVDAVAVIRIRIHKAVVNKQ